MIIQYDTRPDATIDEKLRSLIKSIQLALDEVGTKEINTSTAQNIDISSLSVLIRELSDTVSSYSDAITGIDERVENIEDSSIPTIQESVAGIDARVLVLEGQQPLPAAPTIDGAYRLTVTVTDGVPVYTWELA